MVNLAFIGSTGRTATTLIAAALNQADGVLACHEGYPGADHDGQPALPLINLEHRRAYLDPAQAVATVAARRPAGLLETVAGEHRAALLIDVAYYNAVLATALLDAHPGARLIGIVRGCEAFVRSATTLRGEDLLPVGWPADDKPLTPREKFISLGRIVPRDGSPEKAAWKTLSAIEKNIWLWRETNLALIDCRARFAGRVLLLRFERLGEGDGSAFYDAIAGHLDLDAGELRRTAAANADRFHNRKAGGYQVGPADEWSARERQCLAEASARVEGEIARVAAD